MREPKKFLDTPCRACGSLTMINPDWLRHRRKFAGLTMDDMAAFVGCSIVYVHQIECGKRHVSVRMRQAYEAL